MKTLTLETIQFNMTQKLKPRIQKVATKIREQVRKLLNCLLQSSPCMLLDSSPLDLDLSRRNYEKILTLGQTYVFYPENDQRAPIYSFLMIYPKQGRNRLYWDRKIVFSHIYPMKTGQCSVPVIGPSTKHKRIQRCSARSHL